MLQIEFPTFPTRKSFSTLATSRPHEFQGRIAKRGFRPAKRRCEGRELAERATCRVMNIKQV